jgi:hypothetical protein
VDGAGEDLGEAADLQGGRRQEEHPGEPRELQVDLRRARSALAIDGARLGLADAGGHIDRDLDVPQTIGDHRPELAVADPHRDRGAGAGVKRVDRRALERDPGRAVEARRAVAELDDQQRDLGEAIGRRVIESGEVPGGGRARRIERADRRQRAQR